MMSPEEEKDSTVFFDLAVEPGKPCPKTPKKDIQYDEDQPLEFVTIRSPSSLSIFELRHSLSIDVSSSSKPLVKQLKVAESIAESLQKASKYQNSKYICQGKKEIDFSLFPSCQSSQPDDIAQSCDDDKGMSCNKNDSNDNVGNEMHNIKSSPEEERSDIGLHFLNLTLEMMNHHKCIRNSLSKPQSSGFIADNDDIQMIVKDSLVTSPPSFSSPSLCSPFDSSRKRKSAMSAIDLSLSTIVPFTLSSPQGGRKCAFDVLLNSSKKHHRSDRSSGSAGSGNRNASYKRSSGGSGNKKGSPSPALSSSLLSPSFGSSSSKFISNIDKKLNKNNSHMDVEKRRSSLSSFAIAAASLEMDDNCGSQNQIHIQRSRSLQLNSVQTNSSFLVDRFISSSQQLPSIANGVAVKAKTSDLSQQSSGSIEILNMDPEPIEILDESLTPPMPPSPQKLSLPRSSLPSLTLSPFAACSLQQEMNVNDISHFPKEIILSHDDVVIISHPRSEELILSLSSDEEGNIIHEDKTGHGCIPEKVRSMGGNEEGREKPKGEGEDEGGGNNEGSEDDVKQRDARDGKRDRSSIVVGDSSIETGVKKGGERGENAVLDGSEREELERSREEDVSVQLQNCECREIDKGEGKDDRGSSIMGMIEEKILEIMKANDAGVNVIETDLSNLEAGSKGGERNEKSTLNDSLPTIPKDSNRVPSPDFYNLFKSPSMSSHAVNTNHETSWSSPCNFGSHGEVITRNHESALYRRAVAMDDGGLIIPPLELTRRLMSYFRRSNRRNLDPNVDESTEGLQEG
eukprot:CAMPEP_0175043644 /NCGR_PEP_ID=MMETSP0052_2-20121109/3317_1 /TAXON_ID=51329 ORGANISM="Polytomella parva, Strain SAG 63-3" /NCGR_SAMPLE_ID=MMETSP0052_2 /ASSEMBLY_ACC=CAM_ASM_000194 /LENGTH=795 /DNA_ID=CAMNT_0016306757 /DNA_START=251 /DNA_END=2634 /DNA_ORIENTATION=-